jgi:predicted DNA-binding protein (MmcQ/YjbR family)
MTMSTSAAKPETILQRIRRIALSLDDTDEVVTWGHPTFRVRKKAFAVFEEFKKEWCLCFRVEKAHQELFLKDPRFILTPYVGKFGWVSLRVHAAPLDWKEIRHLIKESHRLNGPVKR